MVVAGAAVQARAVVVLVPAVVVAGPVFRKASASGPQEIFLYPP